MLKKFTVSNYKNFKDEISLDFSKIGEYSFNADSLSMRLIYGRNAIGYAKILITNLMQSKKL